MIKTVIYCQDKAQFEVIKKNLSPFQLSSRTEFIFGNSSEKSREELINAHPDSWLLFLDHDCVPLENTWNECLRLAGEFEKAKKNFVFAGTYHNPHGASLLQKAHNKIANTWLAQSFDSGEPHLLGGIFLIFSSRPVAVPAEKFWGAEDKLLARSLQNAGYNFVFKPEMAVIHSTSKSFKHFVRRALLHGRHDAIYFPQQESSKLFYWIRKTDFSDLHLAPLILLHFCIQRAAKAFQKALPMNKR